MAGRKKSRPPATDDTEARPPVSLGSYDDWTVADLRRRAGQLGLTGYSGKKKAALVAMLREH